MRVSEYSSVTIPVLPSPVQINPSLVAAKLVEIMQVNQQPHVFIASTDGTAEQIAKAARCLGPGIDVLLLPPWDCLPFGRVAPSKQAMGRRMDALRVWLQPSSKPRLLITSLGAALQPVPPLSIVQDSEITFKVGQPFDCDAFRHFVIRTGYLEEALADEPGELVFRDDIVDVFPAGSSLPMRIVLDDNGRIEELRFYDPATQRTTETVDQMTFGPASELIHDEIAVAADGRAISVERQMLQTYGSVQTLFDVIADSSVCLQQGWEGKLGELVAIIQDATEAHGQLGALRESHAFYLSEERFLEEIAQFDRCAIDYSDALPLHEIEGRNRRKALAEFTHQQMLKGKTIVLAGCGDAMDGLLRAVAQVSEVTAANGWMACLSAPSGSLLTLKCGLDRGFAVGDIHVVTPTDVFGENIEEVDTSNFLREPQIRLGDVVVHEDHGVGILKALETVQVEGIGQDAARLEYRDGASILVPMSEFGKLWRYGSSPDAVSLDRLHTEAWSKRRAAINKDIGKAARHLRRLAKVRGETIAEEFAPPQKAFAEFVRRFRYSETAHQSSAIRAVLQDLSSGTPMNRLVCGDVGFGKTEIALRAAAAVAFCGAQVVVIAPTTVLARQHYLTFQRRFANMVVRVEMLSRVVDRKAAAEVKAGLASGEVGVVIATQAVLAKDVRFARLGLLVIDEEHKFGARDKQAMRSLSPSLHVLAMSATPIPRTLQSAMIGIQDVSLLATSPSKRRPVRTTLGPYDGPSMRVALLREFRRGGQSFVVVPQIDDIDGVHQTLKDLVPELSVRVAHGKMKAADMDEVMVGFADGDGDVLLSTNIIESGLDVPRANTIVIWRADRFGIAQLHQLRGRVGRGRTQGSAMLLAEDVIAQETRSRLSTMEANDRLGAGFALSMQDLEMRGAGDIAGDDQAGHMRLLGISFYQKLLERAVLSGGKEVSREQQDVAVNLGVTHTIPEDYVSDGTVRLNLYTRLLRAGDFKALDDLQDEFDDRFGELPDEVSILIRLARLRIAADRFGVCRIDAGPRGLALSFASKPSRKQFEAMSQVCQGEYRDERLVFKLSTDDGLERLSFLEKLLRPTVPT
ncbi:transcription-repair coupling factor (superfamily II helicase) [Neorhizobium huautlense]|uniref:Transcription-repair-coupling factor n=1 Tax=Neorhizobium huautlense TaxID=67774 RepID=A0ABT9PW22_9HYPH|nr:DEAD/DEAH box helicase [Neorhizobium huautlense]MDP9838711.1 transcription-repair coupling factor (superfamily II helicase) [Neorhizobium huautlense]